MEQRQKQEANRKKIQEKRRNRLLEISKELKARTLANKDEANEIWETAKDV